MKFTGITSKRPQIFFSRTGKELFELAQNNEMTALCLTRFCIVAKEMQEYCNMTNVFVFCRNMKTDLNTNEEAFFKVAIEKAVRGSKEAVSNIEETAKEFFKCVAEICEFSGVDIIDKFAALNTTYIDLLHSLLVSNETERNIRVSISGRNTLCANGNKEGFKRKISMPDLHKHHLAGDKKKGTIGNLRANKIKPIVS